MGVIQNLGKYLLDRTAELESTYLSVRTKVINGKYTANNLVNDSLKLWIDGIDGWSQVFAYLPPETVPITYRTLGASASSFSGLVNPTYYQAGATFQDSGLVPLTGGKAKETSPNISEQPDGTLKVQFNVSGQSAGEWYEDIIFYLDTASKLHPIVVLHILIIP